MFRDPKELHKNIDTTGSVDQLDYLEQVMALAMANEMTTVTVLSNIDYRIKINIRFNINYVVLFSAWLGWSLRRLKKVVEWSR